MTDILGQIGGNLGAQLKGIKSRLDTLEGTVPPPVGGLTAETVTWTNLSEINLSGEKLVNADFSQTELAENSSYAFPTGSNPPPNNWSWDEFVVDVQIKWVGSSTANHTQGNVYQANAYRPAWDNYPGNIRIKNDSDNYGWVGNNRGTDWEVVSTIPSGWSVYTGTLDQTQLALGNVDGDGGNVSVEQTFTSPISSGTKLVAKITRSDTNTGNTQVRALWSSGDSAQLVDPAIGYVEIEVPANKTMVGIRIDTQHGVRGISSASVFQGAISGGSVQTFSGGSIEKISGNYEYNAGASSVQKIDGNSDGYVQFQIGHATHSVKIGLVNQDHDFEVDAPWKMNFGGGYIDLSNPWIADHTPFIAGDWFRIRHYSQENEIKFQKRQHIYQANPSGDVAIGTKIILLRDFGPAVTDEIVEVYFIGNTGVPSFRQDDGNQFGAQGGIAGWGRTDWWEIAESLGEDYVTFYTHPTLSNGADLYVDTVFHAVGARLNDVQIAT